MNIFDNTKELTTAEILLKSFEYERSEDLVAFSTGTGYQSGKQVVNGKEFLSLVSAIRQEFNAGLLDEPKKSVTATDFMRESISVNNGVVSFRTSAANQGVRHAKIPVDQFEEVLEILELSSSKLEKFYSSLEKLEE